MKPSIFEVTGRTTGDFHGRIEFPDTPETHALPGRDAAEALMFLALKPAANVITESGLDSELVVNIMGYDGSHDTLIVDSTLVSQILAR